MTNLASGATFGGAFPDNVAIFINFDESGEGPTPPEVGRAVRSVLGLVCPEENLLRVDPLNDDFYAIARNQLKNFDKDDPTGRSSRIYMAYFSSFFHEAKHIHDLLSTVFGQRLLADHYNCYQNVLSVLDELKRWHRANKKPIRIPLRRNVHAMLGLDSAIGPLIDRFALLQTAQDKYGASDCGIYAQLNGSNLLEASATLVQIDMIHDVFDNEGAHRFWSFLREGKASHHAYPVA